MKPYFLLATSVILSACSQAPIIDKGANFDPMQYEKDMAECKQYQEQVKSQAGGSALKGAIVGGLMGAISGDAGDGAAYGVIAGGAEGVGATSQTKKQVLHNCLRGRGYKILN